MNYRDFFDGKKVTIMGLGLLGRAMGDAAFIAECGGQVTVTDKKTRVDLADSVAQLSKYPNITFKLAGHDLADFTSCDLVIKAAGVRLDSVEIATARAAGVPVYMSTALAAKFARETGTKIVGITGTRGKSTITQIIFHTLKKVDRRVHLGGNVRGISTLTLLPEMQQGDILVLELDSWQLQGFGDLQMSPDIAVFSNLMPDHQNYYASMDEYFADKACIFKFQKERDTLVCGDSVVERIEAARPKVAPRVPKSLPESWHLKVQGEHNRENAALSAEALRSLDLTEEEIKSGLESFAGVEGRLQFVREIGGVKVYNDNNATTPEATIAALKALSNDERPTSLILIMGGADKGLDMRLLVHEMEERCKKVILLEGTGTNTLLSYLHGSNHHVPVVGPFSTLEKSVQEALKHAHPGDVVLFSPAYASFGMFKNEYDRNDQFLELVT